MDPSQLTKFKKSRGNLYTDNLSHSKNWATHILNKNVNKNSVNKIHQCKICGLVNNNAWGLTIHMRRHNKDHKSKCHQCSASFVNNYELSKHINSEHVREKKYQCRFCPRKFIHAGSKYYHEDTHGVLRHKCKFCDEVFSTQSKRRNHQKSYHRDGEYSCKFCLKNFADKEFLNRHMTNSHLKTLTCSECHKLFFGKDDLAEHRKTEHKMNLCRKTQSAQKSNERHLYQDSDLKIKTYVFRCGICSTEFNFKVDLTSHIESEHPNEKDNFYKFLCTICSKSFDTKNKLRGHMIGHGPKKHICNQCDYKTARGMDLEKHIRVKHNLEKSFKCTMCSKSFLHRSTYISHKLKHAEAKFKCDICEDTFNIKGQLAQHKRLKHYGESTICDQCGKQFMNPLSLRGHIKNFHDKPNTLCLCNGCGVSILMKEISDHVKVCLQTKPEIFDRTKMKGPTCSKCSITFSTKPDAVYHYKELHPNAVFFCKFCSLPFLTFEALEKHVIKHELKNRPPQRIHRKIFTIDEKRTMKSLSNVSDDFNRYECFACGTSFASNIDLTDHVNKGFCISISEKVSFQKTSVLGDHCQEDHFIIYKIFNEMPTCEGRVINEFFIRVFPRRELSDVLKTVFISHPVSSSLKDLPHKSKDSTTKIHKMLAPQRNVKLKSEKNSLTGIVNKNDVNIKNNHHLRSSASSEEAVKKEILENDANYNVITSSSSKCHSKTSETCVTSGKDPSGTITNSIVSSNQLIEFLQQKTVTVGGSAFLPFSELISNLKLFTGIEVTD